MHRILYIESNDSLNDETRGKMAAALEELGSVWVDGPLSEEALERLKSELGDDSFDGIVSHLPYSKVEPDEYTWGIRGKIMRYGGAIDLLAELKKVANVPIVIYTGASAGDIPWSYLKRVDHAGLVFKSKDVHRDCARVQNLLVRAWESGDAQNTTREL